MSNTSKVWFITGASSGFGKAFAEYALGQGYRVVVTEQISLDTKLDQE